MSDTIVEIGEKKYREVKRVAKVGELIKVTRGDRKYHCKNDIGHVIKAESDNTVRVDFNDHGNAHIYQNGIWWVGNIPDSVIGEYVVLEPVESLTIEQRLSALEAEVSRLIVEFNERINRTKHVTSDEAETATVRDDVRKADDATDELFTREQVIDSAKRAVKDLTDAYRIRFVENRSKRKVTALILYKDGSVWTVGRSRASKSDCFNVHIGRAIALFRAIGRQVTDYYTNAPQPTKAQRGDIVEYGGRVYKIDTKRQWGSSYAEEGSIVERHGRILDDSHDFGSDDK